MKFKLDHIGYLTDSIEKSIITFELLGYEKGDSLFDNIQNIKLQFLKNNNTTIELIEPQKDSKIYNLLNKYNNIINTNTEKNIHQYILILSDCE